MGPVTLNNYVNTFLFKQNGEDIHKPQCVKILNEMGNTISKFAYFN